MFELAALIVGTTLTAIIALVVFLKDNRSATNQLFVGLAVGLVGWSITTYFSLHTASDAETLFWIRLVMCFVVIQNTCFFLLMRVFPAKQIDPLRTKWYLIAIAYSVLTLVVAASPLLFVGFQDGAPVPGPGMALFLPHAAIFAGGGVLGLIMRYRHAKGVLKTQLLYFLAGTILMFTLPPIGNFVVPVLLKFSQFVVFSPLYSIIFSALIAYGIVAKRMFDLRLTIARAVAFILSVATLAILYAAAIFGLIRVFFEGSEVSSTQTTVYFFVALFLAFTFTPLKNFFSRLTKRIFFQDAYDTKLVLDDITSVLVRTVAVNKIAKQSIDTLSSALKSQHITLVILNNEQHQDIQRVITTGRRKPDLHRMLQELERHSHQLLVIDEIDNEADFMYRTMQQSNVAVVARLKTPKELIGYVFFGYKESGNVYTQQDVDLIRIVTDELSVAIQNALRFEQIEHFNATLQHEVNEATKQLRQSNKKLQALDEAKDEFISMASHQLRTPLTSVKGYLSMALEGDAGELKNDQRRLLQEAYASAQRMVYMISDFLNVSRLKTGKFLLEPGTVHLPTLIQEEIEQLAPAAKSRGLAIKANIQPDFPSLQLDENKIRQVLMNFIDNAVFYSNSGGTVTVNLSKDNKEMIFTVDDHGIGVPPSEQKNIFSKFFRATNARHVRPDGTGIGLFMAKKVISAHGGTMIFKSEENKGSTFGFKLPLTPQLKDDPNKLEHQPNK